MNVETQTNNSIANKQEIKRMSTDYRVNDIVWVKFEDYPWWPAKIMDPTQPGIHEEVLSGKQPKKNTLVRFYYTMDFCWVDRKDNRSIQPFLERKDLLTQPKIKSNSDLRKAVDAVIKEYEETTGRSLSDIWEPVKKEKKKPEIKKRKKEDKDYKTEMDEQEESSEDSIEEEPKKKKVNREMKVPPKKEEKKSEKKKSAAPKTEKSTDAVPKVKPVKILKKNVVPSNDKKAEAKEVLTDQELENCNTKLERYINDSNVDKIRETVIFLHEKCEPLTVKQLSKIKIGKTMNKLKKHEDATIAKYSSELVNKWKQMVRDAKSGSTDGSKNVKPTKESTPITPATPTGISKTASTKSKSVIDESLLELTNDERRDYAIKKFANGLANGTSNHSKCATLAKLIEQSIFEHFGCNSSNEGYCQQIRSVGYNLSDTNNKDFCNMVLTGEISPSKIATLSSKEMASNELKAWREKVQKEATLESMTAQASQTKSSMFKCRKCKGNNCSYYQMQTRSADEPMTVFVTCLDCNNRWKC